MERSSEIPDQSMAEDPVSVGDTISASAAPEPERKRRHGKACKPVISVVESALHGSKKDGKSILHAAGTLREILLKEGKPKTTPVKALSPRVEPIHALVHKLRESGAVDAAADAVLASLVENLRYPEVVEYCFSVLLDLSNKKSEHRRDLVAKGALGLVAQGMAASPSKAAVQEGGCGILWVMALDQSTRPAVISAGGCSRVVDTLRLHKEIEPIVEMCFGAIKPLSADFDGRAELVKSDAARAVVLAMMANGDSAIIQRDGCSALSNLAVDLVRNQVSVASPEEIQAILECMGKHPGNAAVQKQACFVLKNFSVLDKNCTTLAGYLTITRKLLTCAADNFPQECAGDAKAVLCRMEDVSSISNPKPVHEQEVPQPKNKYQDAAANKPMKSADELMNSAIMAGRHGEYELAQSYFEEILKLKRSQRKPAVENAELAHLLNCIGYVMASRSDTAGAIHKYKESLSIQQSIRSAEAENRNVLLGIASTMTSIGMLYMKCRDLDNAKDFLIQALQEKRNVYGKLSGNVDAAKDLENIGDLKKFCGKYEEAENFYMESAACYRNLNLSGHEVDLSNVISKLGLLAGARGKNDLALSRLGLALEMKVLACGSEAKNSDLVDTLNNIGYTYAVSGQEHDAIQKYEESVEMQYHIYGGEVHNDCLANTLVSLGVLYLKSGYYCAARDYLEEALDMKRAMDSDRESSVDTLGILLNLGEACSLEGAWDGAEMFYKQAVQEMSQKNVPSNGIADVLMKLGHIAGERKDFTAAQDYFQRAFDVKKIIYGSHVLNEDLAKMINNLAHAASLCGQLTVALDKYELSLKMLRSLHGPDACNIDLADTLSSIGILHLKCSRYAAAEKYLTKALSMKRNIYGDNSVNAEVADLLRNLGNLHMHRMNFEDAKMMYEDALKMIEQLDMDGPSEIVADTRTEMGTLAVLCGDMTSAQEHFRTALELKMDIYGADEASLDIVDALNNLGYAFAAVGNCSDAIVQYEESLHMQRLIQGTETASAEIANTLKTINILYDKHND